MTPARLAQAAEEAGAQAWRGDVADLNSLRAGAAQADAIIHLAFGTDYSTADIAMVIGRRLGLPVKSVPQDTYGPFGPIFAADQPATSAHTQAMVGWRPTHPKPPGGP